MPSLPGSDSRDVLVETIPSQLGLLATHYPVTPPALIECLPHPVLAQTPQTGLPWLVWIPSSSCLISETLCWAALLCRSFPLPLLGSVTPMQSLWVGRLSATALSAKPYPTTFWLHSSPFARCGCVCCLAPAISLAWHCSWSKERGRRRLHCF